MYTHHFAFLETDLLDDNSDFSEFHDNLEDFDTFLKSLGDTVKHVTHTITDIKGGKRHYYTLFMEEKPKEVEPVTIVWDENSVS